MKLEAPKRASRDRNRGDMLESLQQLAKLVIKLSIQSLGVSKSIDCGSQNLICRTSCCNSSNVQCALACWKSIRLTVSPNNTRPRRHVVSSDTGIYPRSSPR